MSKEDDDWFERALEDEADSDATADDADGETAEDGNSETAESDSDDGAADAESDPFGDAPDDTFADEMGTTDDDAFGMGQADDADASFGTTGGAESPFGSEAATDTEAAPDIGGSAEEDLFEEDFASAFGGGAGGDDDDFDDDALESDIPRTELGIAGLDDMIQGGIPERHLVVTIGSAGTGKTTFGLQFLRHGLQKDPPEKAVFITLEQSREAILDTADEFGWEFRRYEEEDLLAVVDLDPVEMANSLENIRGELPELIRNFGADRLVLDSVSLLEMMYDDQAKRRTEVYDFTRTLKKAGVTTMLTSEASENHEFASRHGIIEYLTDAVIFLRYVRQETRETRMAVEIQKIRNANHSRETKPYEITDSGISVYQQANIF
jgi:KaiC domain protein